MNILIIEDRIEYIEYLKQRPTKVPAKIMVASTITDAKKSLDTMNIDSIFIGDIFKHDRLGLPKIIKHMVDNKIAYKSVVYHGNRQEAHMCTQTALNDSCIPNVPIQAMMMGMM